MAILEVPPHVSRVHASRRVFQLLHNNAIDLPVRVQIQMCYQKSVKENDISYLKYAT